MKNYTGYLGGFDYEHKNPPPPFNPDFDPLAESRYEKVTSSMVDDNYYANHTREECKAEWAKRYDAAKNNK